MVATDSSTRTGPEGLFRPEALEHRARQRGPGDVIRVAPRWTTTSFYGLVVLFVGVLIAGIVLKVDRYAQGPIAVDGNGRLVVLLPAAVAPDVGVGRPVEIDGQEEGEVVSSGETILYPAEIRDTYGVDVAAPSIAVVTSADRDSGGIARVLIERESALVALVPGLKALFGDSDA